MTLATHWSCYNKVDIVRLNPNKFPIVVKIGTFCWQDHPKLPLCEAPKHNRPVYIAISIGYIYLHKKETNLILRWCLVEPSCMSQSDAQKEKEKEKEV